MKAKYNIDIEVINNCGSIVHLKMSSSGCDYYDYSFKLFDFNLQVHELFLEELNTITSLKSLKDEQNHK